MRGIGHLTLVPDPDDTGYGESPAAAEPSTEGLAGPGSAIEDPGARPGGEDPAGAGSAVAGPGAAPGSGARAGAGTAVDSSAASKSEGSGSEGSGDQVRRERRGRRRPRAGSHGGADQGGEGFGGEGFGGEGFGGEGSGSEEAARAICLRLLTSGPRTRAQLATALRKRHVPDKVADSVLSRFTEAGLIDDAAFARAWVESRHHSRGLARRALSAELRQRGIPDGEVRSAVGQLGPQDELATARRLVAKRAPATRGKPVPARARSLMGMLARKGYPAGLAAQVVREALEQEQETGPGREDLAWISEEGSGDDWA
jgi:regulatory protein